jgi:ferredoxin-type protein NapG
MGERQVTKKFKITRRKFFKRSTLVVTGVVGALGVGTVPILRGKDRLLRPPGALDEGLFLASCIKCGQCLQVCPPQVIKLEGLLGGFSVGTPYITPREGACILCSGLPCVLACPTGALDHHISLGKEATMGLAVISQPDQCLSILGLNDLVFRLENLKKNNQLAPDDNLVDILKHLLPKLKSDERKELQKRLELTQLDEESIPTLLTKMDRENLDWLVSFVAETEQARTGCRICLEDCPIKEEKPISFNEVTDQATGKVKVVPIIEKTCVGCGVCEERCPTEEASIIIIPRLRWKEQAL